MTEYGYVGYVATGERHEGRGLSNEVCQSRPPRRPHIFSENLEEFSRTLIIPRRHDPILQSFRYANSFAVSSAALAWLCTCAIRRKAPQPCAGHHQPSLL